MKIKNGIKLIAVLVFAMADSGSMTAYAIGNALTGQADTADGATQWSDNCNRCHNYRPAREYSAQNWQPIMMHMRIQAGITGQKARNIYAFLADQSGLAQVPQVAVSAASTSSIKNAGTSDVPSKAPPSASKQQAPAASSAQSVSSGAAIYRQACTACHGSNGKGVVSGAPDFSKPDGVLKNSDAVLLKRIINGYQSPGSPTAMPAKGGNLGLTDEDAKTVLQYIRSKFGK